jgi:hypothetical protein
LSTRDEPGQGVQRVGFLQGVGQPAQGVGCFALSCSTFDYAQNNSLVWSRGCFNLIICANY